MATSVTVIGRTTRVRGRLAGAEGVEVQGFVEGEIAVAGDVTVDTHGMVSAGVRGRRLLVRGAVKGDLVGDEAVLLEEGARVVGDVRAPRVAIAPGALVRGHVQTGEGNDAPAHTSRAQAVGRPAVTPKVSAPSVSKPAVKQAAIARQVTGGAAGPATSANSGGARRPPPPVVPALKKAKGQIAKKKER